MITGSVAIECERRLSTLYNESHKWLVNEAKKITKNKEEAEDLVSELYEYLHLKRNPKIFWGESYNLYYCNKFLHSRFMNKVSKLNRTVFGKDTTFQYIVEEEYDEEKDLAMQKAHDDIMNELKSLQATKMWPQAKLFELYWMSDDTLDEVSVKIGISKSTTFLAVKKIRNYLKQVIENPFNES
jgi:DNA-directed RNA polymerase specialized sigma24 family protein